MLLIYLYTCTIVIMYVTLPLYILFNLGSRLQLISRGHEL